MVPTRIGISLASLLPWSTWNPDGLVRFCDTAGFEVLQFLPLRQMAKVIGIDSPILQQSPYIESAWNIPVSFSQVIRDKLNRKTGAATLIDYAFFGTKAQSTYDLLRRSYPRAQPIHHELIPQGGLIEVLPCSWGMSFEKIEERVLELRATGVEVWLVPDTWHLREVDKNNTLPLGPWSNSLPRILKYAGPVVHLQTRDVSELYGCLKGQGQGELLDMLLCILKSGWQGDLILETTIGVRGLEPFEFLRYMHLLQDFRSWLSERLLTT